MQIVIDIPEQMYLNAKANTLCGGDIIVKAIKNGTPLLDGAEILTKEAYSDLCTRAANVPDTNVGELISRQAAINALWKALYEYEDKTEKQFIESDELNVADWIEHRIFVQNMNDIDRQTILSLPSEQPEKRTEERTETHACDCISRQAAIDALSHMMDTDGFRDGWAVSRANVDCMLRYLPSVEPERKPGHWEWDQRAGEYVCSECGCNPTYEGMTPDVSEIDRYRYCRWCGAKMEVEAWMNLPESYKGE